MCALTDKSDALFVDVVNIQSFMQHLQKTCDNKTRLTLVTDQTEDVKNKLDNLVQKILIGTLIKGSGWCLFRLLNQIDLCLMKINLIAVFSLVRLYSPVVIERQTSTPIQSRCRHQTARSE